jgi:hypothetical protein
MRDSGIGRSRECCVSPLAKPIADAGNGGKE